MEPQEVFALYENFHMKRLKHGTKLSSTDEEIRDCFLPLDEESLRVIKERKEARRQAIADELRWKDEQLAQIPFTDELPEMAGC